MEQEYLPKTAPYKHQQAALNASWKKEFYALFLEMGTGKTKIAIDTMALLFEKKNIDTVLICAPKGVYDNWVKSEIPTHLPDRIETFIVRWQPNLTEGYKKSLRQLCYRKAREPRVLHILVMNIEALSTSKGYSSAMEYMKKNPDNLMIIDESTTIKNRQAKRTKNVVKIAQFAKYKRILTGSPVTKSPMDLFSQCEFLTKSPLGFSSFYAFRGRYAVVRQRSHAGRNFQEIVGYRRLDELNKKLDSFSTRTLKKDCLDLPEKTYVKREVTLTDEQAKLYMQMKKLALAQLENGEMATTQSVLTQLMRLQQITCGFLQPDEEPIQEVKSNRLNELLSVVEEAQGKIIIWATWTYDIRKIAEVLSEQYGEESVATYYGETPQDQRQEIVKQFQDPESNLRFFVGQPRTGGFGLTLTAAKTVIYYSNSYDLETRLQSEDRAHRIGQEENVLYVDLVAARTVDEKILQALRDKIEISSQVLGEKARDWLL
jgi:SNF2 family DNA or RNA helicase